MGKVTTLFEDSAKTIELYPRTKTNAVSDSDGNTLGDIAVWNALDVAGGVNAVKVGLDMDLLWENENPTATFTEQTISYDFSEYAMFVLVCKFNTTSTIIRTSTPIFKGITTLIQCGIGGSGSNYYESYRMVTFNDDSAVFGAGNTSNTNAIPIAIYGIR